MTGRLIAVMLVLAATLGGTRWLSRPEPVLDRAPLNTLTTTLGSWRGHDQSLDIRVLRTLGVNDYVNRVYTSDLNPDVSLYIGFYATQRTGQTIHSPMKCLPGNGWQPLTTDTQDIAINGPDGAQQIHVNRYLVQKDLDKYIVMFWYQMRGRVVSSEYTAKLYLVDGALRTNRTDGALVRIVVPVGNGGEHQADQVAAEFVRDLFPRLGAHLPA